MAPKSDNTPEMSPPRQLIHELFEAQVDLTPDTCAVIYCDAYITYAQLEHSANQLATTLRKAGVGAEDRVCLFADRGLDMVIGMLGILKSGGSYVPVDPGYPAERIRFMLEDSCPKTILVQRELLETVPSTHRPVVVLDAVASSSGEKLGASGLMPSSAAYVVYTSGSTGIPKGVVVEHRNVVGLLFPGSYAPIGTGDCLAHCASPSFDATTWEVWAPLVHGATLLVIPQRMLLEPSALNKVLRDCAVTHQFLTAALFSQYLDHLEEAFSQLCYLLVGGDALDASAVRRALSKPKPPKRMMNVYGPTETTTFASAFEIRMIQQDVRSIPIGNAIAGTCMYVLDNDQRLLSLGEPGEIYIGGAGVARGYLHQPQMSALRFIPDPFSSAQGGRLYRTGDVGRWCDNGCVEFIGRNDSQVKIRGFRVELGEIEYHLRGIPGVREAVVIVRGDSADERRLIAYLVAGDGAVLSADVLRNYLLLRIPEYMIPGAYVIMESLPLTVNGKLDRGSLPVPDAASVVSRSYEAPKGETECRLAAIWQKTLEMGRVGRLDNFFELGGDSITGMKLMDNVSQEFGIELRFYAVYQFPDFAAMCAYLEGALLDGGEVRDEIVRDPSDIHVGPSAEG